MPTYLCHGFRWQRKSVRVYVILQNIDDASPEWIIPAKTSQSILQSFYEVFEFLPYCSPKRSRYAAARDPETDDDDRSQSRARGRGRSESLGTTQSRSVSRARQQYPLPPLPLAADDASSTASEDDFSAQSWSAIKLLEEYDPRDLTAVSRPYAYVADYAVRVDLSCSIVDEIARYEQLQLQSQHPAIAIPSRKEPQGSGSGWFEDLRDQLQAGEEIRWYVVVNDDEVRDCADEEPESATTPPREPGYQQPQYQPYQYQSQSSRPMPSIEQRQHHAQYMHQQRIFEGEEAVQKAEPEQEPPKVEIERSNQGRKREQEQQQQQQQQQQLLDWNSREAKREQERQREREKEKEKEKERERQREQEKQKQREREKERQWQQEKERLREKDRQQQQRQRDQRDQNPPSYGADANGKPPTVPEKDFFHFPRPPTATANAGANAVPLRPKVSLDAGANAAPVRPKMSLDIGARPLRSKISFDAGIGRPKTPGGKGGGLRRLFGRGKVDAG